MPVKLLYSLGLLILSGCTLDYGPELAETMDDTPNIILYGLTYRSVENGAVVYSMVTESAEEFEENREYRITGANFKEFDYEGNPKNEGYAGSAKVNQDTKDAQLSNDITIYSIVENTRLSAPNLSWTDKRKILTSPVEDLVRVERKNNSTIEGRGFSMDLKTRTMQFSKNIQGTYRDTGDAAP